MLAITEPQSMFMQKLINIGPLMQEERKNMQTYVQTYATIIRPQQTTTSPNELQCIYTPITKHRKLQLKYG